ncbi:hypothetical protein IT398_02225 [Candidatus Nomurabacteria bacterium]|nr:hypothetical protein [Candidatus Nomurabacteria bacterium]
MSKNGNGRSFSRKFVSIVYYLPSIFLIILGFVFASSGSPGLGTVVFVVGVFSWPPLARGVRNIKFPSMPRRLTNNEKKELHRNKEVRETKCTCVACDNVWFYGKSDIRLENQKKAGNQLKVMACCSGCWLPAIALPHQRVIDLDKCPKCGSKSVKKEEVVHYV